MTTITLTGTKITQNPVSGITTAVAPITLEMVATGTSTGFTYSVIFSDLDLGLDEVHIDSPILNRATYSDGIQVDRTNDSVNFGDVHWTQGGLAKTSTLLFIVDESAASGYLFQIGGDTIPALNTVAAFNAFGATFTSFSSATGAYAPGVVIPFAPIPDAVVNENDILYGTSMDDTLSSGTGVLDGGIGDDHIYGYGGADVLLGGAGDDQLFGGAGDDSLTGGTGNDTLDGGAGIDTASYADATGAVQVYLKLDKSFGADGKDVLTGIENLLGSGFSDRLIGDAGTNRLTGGAGDDIIKTKGGDDIVFGGDGNDKIVGDAGKENLNGGAGNDTIFGNAGADTLTGGEGADRMYGGRDNDTMFGDGGDDIMRGNLGLDVMLGGAGSDRMYGGGGLDVLNGGTGKDYLFGDNGNDILNGGAGNDSMTGGDGADTFIFEAQATANYDKVKDFTNGDDRLDLSSFGFASFADVQALTTDAGWALKLNFGGSNVLYLEGFALADFDVADVIL